MTKDFAYRLIRAFPQLRIEPTMNGRFRLNFADGRYLFVSATSSSYGWRLLRKVINRKLEAAQ